VKQKDLELLIKQYYEADLDPLKDHVNTVVGEEVVKIEQTRDLKAREIEERLSEIN